MQSGQWLENSSRTFSNVIQYTSEDLFNSPSLKHMRKVVDFSKIKTMLSIGAGNGRFELPLMSNFPLTVDFIEPSPIMHGQLVENLTAHQGPGKAGRVFSGTFDNYPSETKYDLIFANHSFYFLQDPVAAVRRCLAMLNPGGHLAIILHVNSGFGIRIINELDHEKIHGGLTADRLQGQLDIHSDLTVIEIPIPIKEIIGSGGLTARGEAMAEFFSFRKRGSVSPEDKRRVLEMVEEYSDGKTISEKYGFLHLRAPSAGL